ncbi:yellow laccase [Roridomyces roridus]|uniref:laccase n=1 Tax=Roridomyces roridus TaxID=1738132 RepID=A0AAD7BD97_9AGAR|nr:yellow laccase [Roridomyces roridus]
MVVAALLSLSLASAAAAVSIGPTTDLNIVNAVVAPDGFNRSAVLANGLVPGPTIIANKGDTFSINVVDGLTDNTMLRSTSIHWHGFFQANNSWADGPSFVNQCPIAANNSFLYTFPTKDQAGTFSICRRSTAMVCAGAMVVYDPEDPHLSLYDVDDDSTVITIADWYHGPASTLGAIPTLISTLINGLGRYAGGPTSELAVITVTKGLRYRFRLVNIACDPNFIFTIDQHDFTIIEVDSVNHEPLGCRRDPNLRRPALLFRPQRRPGHRQLLDPHLSLTVARLASTTVSTRLSSVTSARPSRTPLPPVETSTNALVEQNLHPLNGPAVPGQPVPGGADITLNLAIALDFTTFTFTVNGVSFVPPTAPVLLQILSGAQAATDLLPSGSVYVLPPNKVVEISVPGGSPGAPHPFHLHGHNFHVVRSAGNSSYNFVNPVRGRCIVSIPTNQPTSSPSATSSPPALPPPTMSPSVSSPDNAGPWFLHCHIDFHLEIGLAIVFAEDTNTVSKSTQPAAWDQLCPIYDALTPDQL